MLPALELLVQERLDLGGALLVGAQDGGRLLVVLGRAHPGEERLLLGFEGLDLLRQSLQLAGFLVAELGFLLFGKNLGPRFRGDDGLAPAFYFLSEVDDRGSVLDAAVVAREDVEVLQADAVFAATLSR